MNGLLSHLDDLKCLIKRDSPSVVAIQETNLLPSKIVTLKGFSVYRSDYLDGSIACGGVCILVNNSCYSQAFSLNSNNIQCIAIQVKLPHLNELLCICNIYLPPSCSFTEADLSFIEAQLPTPHILLGDFNSHNPLWGDPRLDTKGREVEKFLFTHNNLHLLNTGEPTHYILSHMTHSAIDLTFCSTSIFPDLTWTVTDDLFFSHHYPIRISLQTPVTLSSPLRLNDGPTIWNYDKAD